MKHAALLAGLLALLLPPGAAAQTDCTEAQPCLLRVTLDDGVWFDAPGDREAAVRQHHWYRLDVLNHDDRDHTLTLGDRTFLAPGHDGGGPRSRHGPVPFPEAGNLTLRDETSRHEATLHVEAGPPPDPSASAPTAGDSASDRTGGSPRQDLRGPADPLDPPDPADRRKEVPAPLAVPLAALLLAALRRR